VCRLDNLLLVNRAVACLQCDLPHEWRDSPSIPFVTVSSCYGTSKCFIVLPSAHGQTKVRFVEVEVKVNLRRTVSLPVCLGVRHPSGTRDQFFFLLEIFFRQLWVCYFVAPSLMRGRVCNLLYNCFWALPEQSLLGRSPAGLTAIFYCFI
jgi:hypothetical protein